MNLFAALPIQAQDDPVELTLLRTRGQAGVTMVDAVAEIVPARVATSSGCAYIVQITIMRGDGGIVAEETYPRSVSCPAARDTVTRFVDTFTFGVSRGIHTVEMSVLPAGEGARRSSSRAAVEPLPERVRMSDLYLAREVAFDTTDREWPVKKGSIGIAAEAIVDVPLDRPLLGYYVELYAVPENAANGVVDAVIRRENNNRGLATFRLHQFDRLSESRPVAGTISVAGLPEGDYELEVTLRVDGSAPVTREQSFRVRPALRPSSVAATQVAPDAMQRYFAGLSDAELGRFDPLVLWMTSAAERETFTSMDATGRRSFLAQFFAQARVPGGAEEAAEPLRVFLARASEVEREFGPREEGGRPGWRTDRGRLWIRYGTPADRIRRPFPVADTRPYEIWYYDVGPGYVYLFVDEGGFGDYRLLYSTDPTEPTVPGWSARAGVGAVEELDTYYGIQLPRQ
ncbi:MAG TPA: GWxTD domain-containing protein [Longimicrobiales bacterium]